MKLTEKTALEIASDFISRFNPNLWNGVGNPDPDINLTNYEAYDIHLPHGDLLYIQFEENLCWNYGMYCHNVSIYNEDYGTTSFCLGESISDPEALAKSIVLLCDNVEVKEDGWKRDTRPSICEKKVKENVSEGVKRLSEKTALEIANDFIGRFNPNLWDGEGELDPDLDLAGCEVYDVGLSDGSKLYIRYEENVLGNVNEYGHSVSFSKEKCSSSEICFGRSIDNPKSLAASILLMCENIEVDFDGWKRDSCFKVRFDCNFDEANTETYASKDAAEKEIKEDMSGVIHDYFSGSEYDVSDNGKKIEIWQPGGNLFASWERMWI